VVLNGGATAALLDPAILSAVCIEGGTEYTLSDFIKNSSQFTGASASSRDLWNLDSLVSYANWSKQ
ncbi:MAG: hypothetical protein VB122_05250, partial [Erysipelotrichales bacterium]|nr:hypothetical protein [Erysipelotrichales bacterium]